MFWTIDPFREIERIRAEMDSVLGRSFSRYSAPSFPLVNLYDGKDEIIVQAEMPGMKKEEVALAFSENVLTISGNRKPLFVDKKQIVHREERATGEFEKALRIPMKISAENIKAEFKDGILTVTLPKQEEAKPKQIAIEAK